MHGCVVFFACSGRDAMQHVQSWHIEVSFALLVPRLLSTILCQVCSWWLRLTAFKKHSVLQASVCEHLRESLFWYLDNRIGRWRSVTCMACCRWCQDLVDTPDGSTDQHANIQKTVEFMQLLQERCTQLSCLWCAHAC